MIPHYSFSFPSWNSSTAVGGVKRTTNAPLLGSSDRLHGPHTSISDFPNPGGGLTALFLRQSGFSAFNTNVRSRGNNPNVPYRPSAEHPPPLPPLSAMPSSSLSVLNSALSFAKIRKGAGVEPQPSRRRLQFKGMYPKGGGMRDVGTGLGRLDEDGEIDKGLRSFMNPLLLPTRKTWKVFGKGSTGEDDEDGVPFRPFPGASVPPIQPHVMRRPLPVLQRPGPCARRDPRSGIGYDPSVFSQPKMNRFLNFSRRESKPIYQRREVLKKIFLPPSPPPPGAFLSLPSSSKSTAPWSLPSTEREASIHHSLDGGDNEVVFSLNASSYLKRVPTPNTSGTLLYRSRDDPPPIAEADGPSGAFALPSVSYFCGVGGQTEVEDQQVQLKNKKQKKPQKEETSESAKMVSARVSNGLLPTTASSFSFPTSSEDGPAIPFAVKTRLDAPQWAAHDNTLYSSFVSNRAEKENPVPTTFSSLALLPPPQPLQPPLSPRSPHIHGTPASTHTPPLPLSPAVTEKKKKVRKEKKTTHENVVVSDALDSSACFISASTPSFVPL